MTRLSPETHGALGWKPAEGYGFARRTDLVPLAVDEVARAAQCFPVLLHRVEGRWRLVALLGPVRGTSVQVTSNGRWRASYVPAALRVYPFRLAEDGEGLELWPDFPPFSAGDSGVEPFFVEGALTLKLQKTRAFLQALANGIGGAHGPLSELAAAEVLEPWRAPGLVDRASEHALTDLFQVDKAAFCALSDHQWLSLRHQDALGWLYAHLHSLHHASALRELSKTVVQEAAQAASTAARASTASMQSNSAFLAAVAKDLAREAGPCG